MVVDGRVVSMSDTYHEQLRRALEEWVKANNRLCRYQKAARLFPALKASGIYQQVVIAEQDAVRAVSFYYKMYDSVVDLEAATDCVEESHNIVVMLALQTMSALHL